MSDLTFRIALFSVYTLTDIFNEIPLGQFYIYIVRYFVYITVVVSLFASCCVLFSHFFRCCGCCCLKQTKKENPNHAHNRIQLNGNRHCFHLELPACLFRGVRTERMNGEWFCVYVTFNTYSESVVVSPHFSIFSAC